MGGVEEAVQLLAVPAQSETGLRAERLGNGDEGADRERCRLATLGSRDRGLREASTRRDLCLRPAAAAAEGTDREAEPNGIHGVEDGDGRLSASCGRCATIGEEPTDQSVGSGRR
jgi:hypothetical protein